MSHPAEAAAAGMEKKSIAITSAILLGLAAAPFLTRGINRMVGYDPRKKLQKAQQPSRPQLPPAARRMPMPFPPRHVAPWMLHPAHGLHAFRARM